MGVLVQKYGGSSVASVDKLAHVADRVVAARRAGHDIVVVVSAMGKTTDELLGLARAAAQVGHDAPFEPPRRELDMLLSTGERVSMSLLSIAIQARGQEAISFTGSQSGIMTDDRHFDARILEVRPHRIEDELARGKIVIVAGYQGMSYRREITTLGRGGSDTTAVALAAALGAEACEIYSDVDGVYSADPRVVPEARHLPVLELALLQEMAEAGAKVLNAQAVEWARRAKIVLHARRTTDPLGTEGKPARETVAGEGIATGRPPVRAVVGLHGAALARAPRARWEVFCDAAARLELPLLDVQLSEGGLLAVLPLLNVPDWAARRGQLLAEVGSSLSLREGMGVASVVGDGLTANARALPEFARALRRGGVEPELVGAGPLRIAAAIPELDLAAAQVALHAAFVAPDTPSLG